MTNTYILILYVSKSGQLRTYSLQEWRSSKTSHFNCVAKFVDEDWECFSVRVIIGAEHVVLKHHCQPRSRHPRDRCPLAAVGSTRLGARPGAPHRADALRAVREMGELWELRAPPAFVPREHAEIRLLQTCEQQVRRVEQHLLHAFSREKVSSGRYSWGRTHRYRQRRTAQGDFFLRDVQHFEWLLRDCRLNSAWKKLIALRYKQYWRLYWRLSSVRGTKYKWKSTVYWTSIANLLLHKMILPFVQCLFHATRRRNGLWQQILLYIRSIGVHKLKTISTTMWLIIQV